MVQHLVLHLQDCFSRLWVSLLPFSIKTLECFLVARWGLQAICRMLNFGSVLNPEGCVSPLSPPVACEIFETRRTWIQVKGIIGCETPTRHLKYSILRALQGIMESCVWMWRGQGKESAFFWAARHCLVASWPLEGAVVLGFEDIVGVAWHGLVFQRRCPQSGEGHPSRRGRESFFRHPGF